MRADPMVITLLLLLLAGLINLINWARRSNQRSIKYKALINEQKPFCLYLRSFADDGTGTIAPLNATWVDIKLDTFEKRLSNHLFGKLLVAVGRPGENLPNLGAKKMYLEDSEWKQKVAALISKAAMVILKPSNTLGLQWELKHLIESGSMDKTVLFHTFNDFGDRKLKEYYYNEFANNMKNELGFEMEPFNPRDSYSYFDEDGLHQTIGPFKLRKYFEKLVERWEMESPLEKAMNVGASEEFGVGIKEEQAFETDPEGETTENKLFGALSTIFSGIFVFAVSYVAMVMLMDLFKLF